MLFNELTCNKTTDVLETLAANCIISETII